MKYKIDLEELIDLVGGSSYIKTLEFHSAYEQISLGQEEFVEGLETLYSDIELVETEDIYKWCEKNCRWEEI